MIRCLQWWARVLKRIGYVSNITHRGICYFLHLSVENYDIKQCVLGIVIVKYNAESRTTQTML